MINNRTHKTHLSPRLFSLLSLSVCLMTIVPARAQLHPDLILYYPLNTQSGTVVENLGSLATAGTLTGTPDGPGGTGYYTPGQSASFGTALNGNRSGSDNLWIETGFTSAQLGFQSGNATFMAWIRWDGTNGHQDHMVFGNNSTPSIHYGIRADSANNTHFGTWGGDINDAGTVPAGTWVHQTFVQDGATGRVYINGIQTAAAGYGINNSTASKPVRIGGHPRDGLHSFNGAIDEVKVFSRALTALEIQGEMTVEAIASFTATPDYIFTGQSSVLDWDAFGFNTLTIDDGTNPPVDVTALPDLTVSPSVTTIYTLTGTSAAGSQTAQATVFVDTPPVVNLTASDIEIGAGQSTTLQWTSNGATGLTINQGIGNVFPQTDPSGSGSEFISSVPSTTTYTITASNPAGSVQDSVTITTGVAPVINSFTVAEPNPVPGEVVALSWNVSDADTVAISPNVGVVDDPVSGTACDFPASSTTYTLTATNGFAQSTAQVSITLPQPIGIDSNRWTVLHRTSTGTINSLATADALLAGSGVAASQTVNNVSEINYGPGNAGEFPGDNSPPLGEALDNFVLRATATLVVNFPGSYTFGINNDDGGRLRIDGADIIVDDALHGPLTTNGTVNLTAGTHSIEYIYFEQGGGEAGEVFFVNGEGVDQQLAVTGTGFFINTTDVVINEFMADNNKTLDDFEGQSEDWIELYNGSGSTINLAGYFLTDDISIPNKWPIPAYSLTNGSYLVIFASSKNTTFGASEFHTNFKLSNNGEYLGLYRSNGIGGHTVVSHFSPAYPPQEEDVSYGRWGNSQHLGYMPTPSPGTLNVGGVDGFVGDTHFDIDRGLFSAPFNLTITTDQPSATIRYTTDGSWPTINHGTIYAGPISISETTVIRAAGFLKGYLPTNVDTHTYIFPNDVPFQDQAHAVALGFPAGNFNGQDYEWGMTGGGVTDPQIIQGLQDIPTISLAIEQDDFSSAATGIYSNPGNRGKGWERPASVELLNEKGNGLGQFQKNCGLRVRGGFSRSKGNPKHAFRLFFRNEYEGDLFYPMFQDEGASRFENIDLRTSQNYSWAFQNNSQNTFLREVLGRDSQRDMGQPYTRSRYYQLYVNGVYWGLYMSQERAEAYYGETYLGGDENNYDVIKSGGSSFGYRTEATDGTLNGDWAELHGKVRAIQASPTNNAAYFAIQSLSADGVTPHPDPITNPDLLEVENLIDYILAIYYTGNYDAPLSTFLNGASNNWFGMRDQLGTDGFRFFVHDGEHSMGTGNNSNNRVGPWSTGGNYASQIPNLDRSNPQFFHEDLAHNAEYRIKFADRVHKHLFNGGALTDAAILARMDTRYLTITEAVRAELARWGGGFSYNTWLNARQDIINFVNSGTNSGSSGIGRTAYIIGLLQNYNHNGAKPLYPSVGAPVYSMNGGSVPVGFNLGMTNPNGSGTIYYTTDGSDPRAVGGGVGGSASIAGPSVTLTASGSVKARVLQSGTWSAVNDFEFIVGIAGSASQIVVSELNYNPTSTLADTYADKDDYEFIELLNLDTTDTVELTGVSFSNGITFNFTGSNVTQLTPGGRVVVVKNLGAFMERYPAVPLSVIAGEFTGSLENQGERITIIDSTSAVIKDFVYDDQFPWPTSPDGDGYTLVLNCDSANPDHNLPSNWRSHGTLHGNPGGTDGETWSDYVLTHGLSGVPTADADLDATTDYYEYVFGTDPNDKNSDNPAAVSLQSVFVAGEFKEFLTITVQRNLNAGEIVIYPEFTVDLLAWTEMDIVMYDALNQGDGTEIISWRANVPAFEAGKARCFMRLRIEGK